MSKSHLVYGLASSLSGEVFYVGKARNWSVAERHLRPSHQASDRNLDKLRAIARCLCRGGQVQVWPLAVCRSGREAAERTWTGAGVRLTNRLNSRARINSRRPHVS